MITLVNGDKWIIDEKELESVEGSKLPTMDIRDFLNELLNGGCLPRKFYNRCWDSNFDAHTEILTAISAQKMERDFFVVYEMTWGEIIVIYHDKEGNEPVQRAARFPDRETYMQSVTLPD